MGQKFREYKGLDLVNVADEILRFWDDNDIFEKSISTRKGNTPFVFFEGPPSANGLPGIHHVMSRAIKDIFCRYKTMQGFEVERKAGWDTHGLPIELGVEKCQVIATGGDADFFADNLIEVSSGGKDFTLRGLVCAFKYVQKNGQEEKKKS